MPQRTGRPPGLRPDGPKIRRIRVDRGLTVAEVADRIGRHKGSVQQAETKSRPISDVFASRLARVLGVEVEDIAAPPGAEAA